MPTARNLLFRRGVRRGFHGVIRGLVGDIEVIMANHPFAAAKLAYHRRTKAP